MIPWSVVEARVLIFGGRSVTVLCVGGGVGGVDEAKGGDVSSSDVNRVKIVG